MSLQDIEELTANLSVYKEQLQQVKQLLAGDPGNAEFQEMAKGLTEVLELTYDLLNEAQQAKEDADAAALEQQQREAVAASTQRPPRVPIKGQQEKSLAQNIPGRLPIGSKVQAVWSEDAEWYMATIEAITPAGYIVIYDEWGNKEEVDVSNVRELNIPDNDADALDQMLDAAGGVINPDADADIMFDAEREAEVTRLAIKQKIAEAADVDAISRDLPPKLRIKPDDSEDVKAAKRKKIHAFKSKARLEQMELTQNKRQNAWHQFQTAKGKNKKVGFFTGRKKESIFKSPDDPKGKVGVTGSGKGITDFHKREKHLHLKVGGEDGESFV